MPAFNIYFRSLLIQGLENRHAEIPINFQTVGNHPFAACDQTVPSPINLVDLRCLPNGSNLPKFVEMSTPIDATKFSISWMA